MDKKLFRMTILNKRIKLNKVEILEKSKIIGQRLLNLKKLNAANIIGCYLAIGNEVNTQEIIDELISREKNVYVPRYLNKLKDYRFSQFGGWDRLEKGPFKILQPVDQQVIDASQLEVAIVPGVAFDKTGVRLGWGKGVYDMLLSGPQALKIGLSYEFQIVDEIPKEEHDLVMDLVVTEKRILEIKTT